MEMCDEIIDLLKEHLYQQNQRKLRVLLMRGSGDKAFSAGADIVSLYNAHKNQNID